MKKTMTEKKGKFTLNDAEFRISQMEKEIFHHRDRLEKRIKALEVIHTLATGENLTAVLNRISVLENNVQLLLDEANRQANQVVELRRATDVRDSTIESRMVQHIENTKNSLESLNTIMDNRLNAMTAAMNWGDKKREDEQRILTVTVSTDGAVEVKR